MFIQTRAGVKEGATTDQEEGGGQRERGRTMNAPLPKTGYKLEDAMSYLRISGADGSGSALGGEGAGGGAGGGGGAPLALELAGNEHEIHRARQDSSRSPLPHEAGNAAGGEDDASVLDTPLQRNVSVVVLVVVLVRGREGGGEGINMRVGLSRFLREDRGGTVAAWRCIESRFAGGLLLL